MSRLAETFIGTRAKTEQTPSMLAQVISISARAGQIPALHAIKVPGGPFLKRMDFCDPDGDKGNVLVTRGQGFLVTLRHDRVKIECLRRARPRRLAKYLLMLKHTHTHLFLQLITVFK